jgi:hypothetical protein
MKTQTDQSDEAVRSQISRLPAKAPFIRLRDNWGSYAAMQAAQEAAGIENLTTSQAYQIFDNAAAEGVRRQNERLQAMRAQSS